MVVLQGVNVLSTSKKIVLELLRKFHNLITNEIAKTYN